jgi:hypothetical protein
MDDQNLTPEGYAKEWLSFAEMDLSSAEFFLGLCSPYYSEID